MSTVDSTKPVAEIPPEVRYGECPGRPGYRVGTDGTAWSCHRKPRKSSIRDGIWWRLSPATLKKTGRRVITIHGKNVYVHKLVLEAFVGPCPPGMQCCHGDGNPANNTLTNLRWGTPKSNQADRDRHGRTTRGEHHWAATITEPIVRAVKEAAVHNTGWGRYNRLAVQFGISKRQVKHILVGDAWKHVT